VSSEVISVAKDMLRLFIERAYFIETSVVELVKRIGLLGEILCLYRRGIRGKR
jgi:hypothetical protein